ncbi:anti-sigma factor [Streptomyces halstedii]|uniref:anti-sigma factor n=1 Tax=Streptomyces halstedii TaxID=1944 RepID=UPI00346025DD
MSTAELHTLTGAYALHALPEGEQLAFERHLGACEACAQEVRELSATAARLGLAVSATAPPALRERVLREITTVRQEPPPHGRSTPAAASPRRRAGRWPVYALAACLAVSAALGGVAVRQHQAVQDARQEAQRAQRHDAQVSRVLAAPDARTATAALEGGAQGTVVVSRSVNRAVFAAAGLPRPSGGQVYQLWFDDGGTMRSAGLVETPDTDGTVLMDGPVDRASGMGITLEPAGGSPRPTTPPLGLMGFPAA